MDTDAQEASDSDTDSRTPYEVLTTKNLKAIKKRAGAPRWTTRLAKVTTKIWSRWCAA